MHEKGLKMAEFDYNNPSSERNQGQPFASGSLDLPEIEAPEDDFLSRGAREFDMSKNAGLDEEEVPSETRESFSALRESISQGRELKAREK